MASDTQQICARHSESTVRFELCCVRSEGFESGLTASGLDVGKWERASGTALKHSDDECGTEFS